MVESDSDSILKDADKVNVAFLVVGDPFGYVYIYIINIITILLLLISVINSILYSATTHTDLVLRARSQNIEVKTIHNASIMNAIGCCGLQLYNYGQTVSIVFFTETWRPDSFYPKIKANRDIGLHTLCLLGKYLLT